MATRKRISQLPLHLMLLPAVILVLIYSYVPMAGIIIAFQRFIPAKGLFGDQKWIGLGNFSYILSLPDTWRVLRNTVWIAFMKIVAHLIVPIIAALLLNEMRRAWVKRGVQTLIYLPYFLSWVILGGVLIDILSPDYGIINQMMAAIGLPKVFFLGDVKWFPYIIVITDVWKNFGFNTVIYLAALTAINPELYEAAVIDGANRWQQTAHVTLPGMLPIIVLIATLSLGNVLNAGFDQVFNLYSPIVYESGDILDTFVYRIGLINAQYGVATAVGLFRSFVSAIFIAISYYLAWRLADYRIF